MRTISIWKGASEDPPAWRSRRLLRRDYATLQRHLLHFPSQVASHLSNSLHSIAISQYNTNSPDTTLHHKTFLYLTLKQHGVRPASCKR